MRLAWRKIVVLVLLSATAGLLIFLVDTLWLATRRVSIQHDMVQQIFMYKKLLDVYQETGVVPSDIPGFLPTEDRSGPWFVNHNYYPQAFGKSGDILFFCTRSIEGKQVITMGDGRMATVSHLHDYPQDKKYWNKPKNINSCYLHMERNIQAGLMVLYTLLVLILYNRKHSKVEHGKNENNHHKGGPSEL